MYAPPFIVTPALLRALRLANDAAATDADADAAAPPRASLAGLPDALVRHVAAYSVETHPHPSPRYVRDGLFTLSYRSHPLRYVDRRGARLLPSAEPVTFQLPQGLCTIA